MVGSCSLLGSTAATCEAKDVPVAKRESEGDVEETPASSLSTSALDLFLLLICCCCGVDVPDLVFKGGLDDESDSSPDVETAIDADDGTAVFEEGR